MASSVYLSIFSASSLERVPSDVSSFAALELDAVLSFDALESVARDASEPDAVFPVFPSSSASSSADSGVANSQTVLVTRTGSKYHTHKCGNGTYYEATLDEALARGLTPCEKCY